MERDQLINGIFERYVDLFLCIDCVNPKRIFQFFSILQIFLCLWHQNLLILPYFFAPCGHEIFPRYNIWSSFVANKIFTCDPFFIWLEFFPIFYPPFCGYKIVWKCEDRDLSVIGRGQGDVAELKALEAMSVLAR